MQDLVPVALEHRGTALVGQLAAPDGTGPHPGVLVMATAMGLSGQMREVAARLAGDGYVAIATDMYGDGVDFESNGEGAGGCMAPLLADPALLRARVVAWYETLRARPDVDPGRIAALGYCFGGMCVLELARSGAELKLVVSYHGLLKTALPAARGAVRPLVAVYAGRHDPFAPPADVDGFVAEMEAAEARWQLTIFGHAAHGFATPHDFDPPRAGIAYDPLADAVSWAGTLALLRQLR